jgi:hypothetical protein
MSKGLRRSLKDVYAVLDGMDSQVLLDIAERLGERQTLTVAGSTPEAGVTVTEMGTDAMRRTRLTLVDVPCPMTSITTGNGIGGVDVYDFPEGFLQILGTVADLGISVDTGNQADFTDGTPEGDIGIGSVIIVDPTAFSTDAEDDDFAAGVALVMSAFDSPSNPMGTQASQLADGSTTPVTLNVNALIDAADIDDGVTSEVLINGTIDVVWSLIGDI